MGCGGEEWGGGWCWEGCSLSWRGKWNGWQVEVGMRRRSCVSWINVNTAARNYCGWSSSFGLGCGVKRAATSLQVQSNENVQVTGAFNCIYGKATSEDCRGLSWMKAQPHDWKIWFSLNIAFRLLIRRERWDHHRNTAWADGFIWTCHENTWVLLLRRITCYTAPAAKMKFLMEVIGQTVWHQHFLRKMYWLLLARQIWKDDDWQSYVYKYTCF